MTDQTYTGAQLTAALDTTKRHVCQAAGDPGVDDVFAVIRDALPAIDPAGLYTVADFAAMLNAAADELHTDDYENDDTIWADDVANLAVNCAGYLLEHPGAELAEIIPAQYTDVDPDFDDLPEGAQAPERGSGAWNDAVTGKVMGWVA